MPQIGLKTNFQGFNLLLLHVKKRFSCLPSGQPLLKSLQNVISSLSLCFKQVSYFNSALYLGAGICQASDGRNATFTQSQDLCDSWHLCLIGVCIKVSCRHIVADLAPHYLQRCAFVRASRKEAFSVLALYFQGASSTILSNCFPNCSKRGLFFSSFS